MSKYIFLDIDGVLNSYFGHLLYDDADVLDYEYTADCHYTYFNTQNMLVLKFIMDNIKDANIVLSSSWNINEKRLAMINDTFNYYEISRPIASIRDIQEDGNFNKMSLINKYITKYNISLEDIVILDDEWLDNRDHPQFMTNLPNSNNIMKRFIKINPHDGLNYASYEKICELFDLPKVEKIK